MESSRLGAGWEGFYASGIQRVLAPDAMFEKPNAVFERKVSQ
jgi:hypothetical protein